MLNFVQSSPEPYKLQTLLLYTAKIEVYTVIRFFFLFHCKNILGHRKRLKIFYAAFYRLHPVPTQAARLTRYIMSARDLKMLTYVTFVRNGRLSSAVVPTCSTGVRFKALI